MKLCGYPTIHRSTEVDIVDGFATIMAVRLEE